MDPSGGWFLWILLAVVLVIVLLWIFATHVVAAVVSLVLGLLFFGFVAYILMNTRFS